jgi:hypothetical protein
VSTEPPVRKRPRHLLDPDNLPPPPTRADRASLTHVQRWVMSILTVTTIGHLCAGLLVAAALVSDEYLDARIGLNVMGTLTAVLAVAAFLGIHQKPVLSPWLLLGLVPGALGFWVTFAA